MMRWQAAMTVAVAGFGAFIATPANAQSTLWLRPAATAEVAWRGMLPAEGSGVGSSGQMLYPAPGVAGLLVAIFAHAAINQGVQSAARKREQEEADKVLEPYLPALRAWPAPALWEAALTAAKPTLSLQTLGPAQAAGDQVVVDVAPVFTLSQDEGVLIADVAIKRTAATGAPATESVVRVVSSPHSAADARAHWSADEGQRLKTAAAQMLAHALVLNEQLANNTGADTPTRTHRYLQGSVERSERAQMLAGDCARAVLRTLRGWLLSVPLQAKEGEVCASSTPF